MASSHEMLKVLEKFRVSPPPSSVGEKSLPLTFSDIAWIHFNPVNTLFFYKFCFSKTHFVETTIPSLKRSLSLALKHYYPFAGNLLFPPNLEEPEFHYRDGDSVLLTFAESDSDFDYLTKAHQKEVARFHPLVPGLLPPVSVQHDTLIAPVFSVQVTLFPNVGISLGFTYNHAVTDGNSFIRFMNLWGTIHKSQKEPMALDSTILPFYDRSTILKQTNKLGSFYWQRQQKTKFQGYQPLLPTSDILASFVLSQVDLQHLKKRVRDQCPTCLYVSAFTVTCAYTWACIIKAGAWIGEEASENQWEFFDFLADCRAHLDPPLPENYFGNCVVPCRVTTRNARLVEEDGFINAANLLGEAIRERIGSEKGVLEGLDKLYQQPSLTNRGRKVIVAGSPRFAVYDIDFGLGELEKSEIISIDQTISISLHEAKANKQDIEIGVSLPNVKLMDAFASIFSNGLMVAD